MQTVKERWDMEIEIKIEPGRLLSKIIIVTGKVDKDTEALVDMISRSESEPELICGFKDDVMSILDPGEISRVYSEGRKITAVTQDGEYVLKKRLVEIEELLEQSKFARISNSEIINLKKVKHFDLSFRGTICVKMNDGSVTYVSRRYVSKIKTILGV